MAVIRIFYDVSAHSDAPLSKQRKKCILFTVSSGQVRNFAAGERGMTLYQLKIFEAVARYLNITQASSELHASQPAISQQLKLLQEEYGTRFFLRHSHGIDLT